MVENKLKEGDTPLFDLDDKELIRFAHGTKNQFISDTVAPEMMRRMKISIQEFNENSSEQTRKMINLTRWIIGLTIAMTIGLAIQIYLLLS